MIGATKMALSPAALNDSTYYTFAQMTKEVIGLTNRPDRITDIYSMLVSTTMKMHTLEFFYKDIVEAQAIFEVNPASQTASFIQELDTSTLPRYRSIAYIRKWDPKYSTYQQNPSILPPMSGFQNAFGVPTNPLLALKDLEEIEPGDFLDLIYRTEKQDVYYVTGSTIKIKSSTALSQALIGWYAYPRTGVSDAVQFSSYDSWIAREYPWAIIYDTAGSELVNIGETDAAQMFIRPPNLVTGDPGGLVNSHVTHLRNSNIIAQGR